MSVEFNIKEEHKLMLIEIKNLFLLIITLIDLIFILISMFHPLSNSTDTLFLEFDLIVCILIFIDLMFGYFTSQKSLREFFIKDKNIITLISVVPFYFLLRYFMIFQIFQFVRIISLVRAWHLHKNSAVRFFISHHLFNVLLIILVVYVTLSSVLLVIFDSAFNSIWDGFWFSVVTATTVGYGDITPETSIGKALGILTIIVGIIFVSVFTAYLSSVYNEKSYEENRNNIISYLNESKEEREELREEIKELKEYIKSLEDKQNQSNKKIEDKLDDIQTELENNKR